MNNSLQKISSKKQELDPNVLQRKASEPDQSVWVSASAGSGKTKVLTDRILRLLLPDAKGYQATPPHKILALTFTKAGASEMAIRIHERLSEWATIPLETSGLEKGLLQKLNELLGKEPSDVQVKSARQLFASVVDTPGGLKIMTIHSFCQSVLGQFPLEADLSPNFKPLEEAEAKKILIESRDLILKSSNNDKGSPLSEAVYNLSLVQNEDQLTKSLDSFVSEKKQVTKILNEHFGSVDSLYTALCQQFGIPAGISQEKALAEFCIDTNIDESALRSCCAILSTGTPKTDQPNAINIQEWLDADQKNRITLYDKYKSVFLTSDNSIRVNIATKSLCKKYPEIDSILRQESERILNLENCLNAIKISSLTRDLFTTGQEILQKYQLLKEQQNALDFDDLILKTLDLLQGQTNPMNGLNITPWVRFKMDKGIDHILVDEAQDTNPEQWEIIKSLCDDFYDGISEEGIERTVFVVGDEKQSIFSFQRASPKKFQEMYSWFNQKITDTQRQLNTVEFITSFRSVKSVLKLVDAVFSDDTAKNGLGLNPIEHKSWRYKKPGLVELWPIFENTEKLDIDPWAPPTQVSESISGAAQLAAYLAKTVAKWIDNQELLESYNRPIKAGDIMILVRSRTAFLDQLVKALKEKNIPVSGVDRMILGDQLVIQDLCACAQFSLMPNDDLNLAGLLKSPFIGWSEKKLFESAHLRSGSLWSNIKQSKDINTVKWLENLIDLGSSYNPYDFFITILQNSCPADDESGLRAIKKRLGDDCLDPLDEFLNTALSFEQDTTPSMQYFLQKQLHDETEIKRQMEEAGNAVRIMTVHGAKGLQAPIVILPDTTRNASSIKINSILWPDKTNADLPYFCPNKENIPALCEDAISELKERDNEEYRRLLYVALTRAEDRLYVAGYKSMKPIKDDSWYNYVENGFSKLENVEKIKDGDIEILRHYNPALDGEPDHTSDEYEDSLIETSAPDWLFQDIPVEPYPTRPLTPSKPSGDNNVIKSPLELQNTHSFVRGNITHKLLQVLPNLDREKQQNTAINYVSQPGHNLSKKICNEIVQETMAILTHKDFAPIFGENSYAEVSISGLLNNKTAISGQIDRLLITDDQILIIDYKTGKPPADVIGVPEQYKKQLQAYAAAIKGIYPERRIKTALIWTNGPILMEIPLEI